VALADLGRRRYVFQRDAAAQPLHAQVFSKIAHHKPENGSSPQIYTQVYNKPGPGSRQRNSLVFPFFS
jgi:hypothetical protein